MLLLVRGIPPRLRERLLTVSVSRKCGPKLFRTFRDLQNLLTTGSKHTDEQPAANPEQQRQQAEIRRKVMHLHRVTGHGSIESLVHALKARGASEEVLRIAKDLQCPVCQEHEGRAPRRHSTLETIPCKWERIQVDAGDWTHPVSGNKFRFVLFIDEGSRFRTGQALAGDPRKAGNWEDIQKAYEQVWLANHGAPAVVRVDPAGAWRSHKADEYFAERGIMLEPIPAKAWHSRESHQHPQREECDGRPRTRASRNV